MDSQTPGVTSASLTPPDPERCQANPNVLRWSPFSLGPMPEPVRCSNPAAWLAEEVRPGKDGLCGAMTLCEGCADLMRGYPDFMRRVGLTRLAPGAEEK